VRDTKIYGKNELIFRTPHKYGEPCLPAV